MAAIISVISSPIARINPKWVTGVNALTNPQT